MGQITSQWYLLHDLTSGWNQDSTLMNQDIPDKYAVASPLEWKLQEDRDVSILCSPICSVPSLVKSSRFIYWLTESFPNPPLNDTTTHEVVMCALHYCTFQQTKAHRNEWLFWGYRARKQPGAKIHRRPGTQSLELLTQDTFHYDLCIKFNQQTAKQYSMQE